MSGSVHDFLATRWVVFNVADVAVLIDLIGCAVSLWNTQDTTLKRSHRSGQSSRTQATAAVPLLETSPPRRSFCQCPPWRKEVIPLHTIRRQLARATILASSITVFVIEAAPRIRGVEIPGLSSLSNSSKEVIPMHTIRRQLARAAILASSVAVFVIETAPKIKL